MPNWTRCVESVIVTPRVYIYASCALKFDYFQCSDLTLLVERWEEHDVACKN